MPTDPDTIVAISTPPGRGGIGIVRLSGPQARAIAGPSYRLKLAIAHGQARFGHVVDESGATLDEAVVTFFAAPHSYTTEDVVEIATHAAPVLLEYLVRAAIARGARLAQPGEFTQRAFLAGRLDLTQAEAVHDLISAQTLQQAKTAAAQLGGALAQAVAPVKAQLLQLIAALEAGVDFAEDDLDLLSDDEVVGRLAVLQIPLQTLANSYAYGRVLREGLTVAIVGSPNAGKSSLFNRLLGRDRAIVTALPGTTRDPVAERLSIDGIPLELVDTAGLREMAETPETEAERAGIARSRRTAAEADLILHVVDGSTLEKDGAGAHRLRPEDEVLRKETAGIATLLIVNKLDLSTSFMANTIAVSALTGAGFEHLREALRDAIAARPSGDSAVITNLRQSQAISGALESIAKASTSAHAGFPHEFLLLDLHESLARLDELTGATASDTVLNLIFAGFCIGK